MNLLEHSIRIPGPLRAIEMSPLEVARRIVHYHDNPRLLKEFRLVVRLHDDKWYAINRGPEEVEVKPEDAKVSVKFAAEALGSLTILQYGILDEEMKCLYMEQTYLMLLSLHIFSPRYSLNP